MKCPNCKRDLKQAKYKGMRVDECENCGGKWFDKDELRQAKDNTDHDLRWLDFDMFDEKENKFQSSPSKKQCPKDASEMTSLNYMNSKVSIDKCNKCKGVWLDKSEFEKIIKYLEHVVISTPSSEYGKETLKEFSEIFNGPESTVSEIKDFLSIANFYSLSLQVENPWTITLSENIQKNWPIS